ncbi:hypothetical protein OROMI_009181 [Orobanche minor]
MKCSLIVKLFEDEIRSANPSILEHEIGNKIDDQFAEWFKNFVQIPSNNIVNKFVQDLAKGPLTQVVVRRYSVGKHNHRQNFG